MIYLVMIHLAALCVLLGLVHRAPGMEDMADEADSNRAAPQ